MEKAAGGSSGREIGAAMASLAPLSTVLDSNGHIIKRYVGDVLVVSRADGAAVSADESRTVSSWYWRVGGVRGNDPQLGDAGTT